MRLPKMTLRRLMVAVAVMALTFRVGVWAAKAFKEQNIRAEYRSKAAAHHVIENDLYLGIAIIAKGKQQGPLDKRLAEIETRYREWAEYHAEQRRRYERAANRPWEPLQPGPSEPPGFGQPMQR